MNVIYKVVFNYATGQWTAVSEIAKGKTKSSRTNSAVVEQTTRQVKYSPVRMVSASLLLGLVSFLGTNSAYALTNDDRIQIAVDFLAPDGQRTAVQAIMQNSLEQPVASHLVTNGSRVNIAMKSALTDSLDGTVKAQIDTKLQTALAKAVKEQLATDANLKQQVITTVLEDFQKGSIKSQLANDIKNFSVEAVAAELLNDPASTIKAEIEHISKNALSSDLAQKANVSEVNDRFEAHKGLIDSVTDAIHGSEGLNAQVQNLKTNSVTKEELEKGLKDKASQSDFNFLNEEVNKLNVGIANVATTATQTARDLEQTNTELAELKLSAEATKEILNSQVENINGSLATISNDVTELKDKVANTASKEELNDKVGKTEFNILNQQVNQNSVDVAEAKAAANEVADDLNEFKYNSAVAIAGLAVTTAEEFEKTNAEVEKAKDGVAATQAMLNSQVENINGSLETISNDVTELKDKVANTASKEELNDKVGKTEFNILNQQVNQNSVDVAEAKAAANEVADDLNEFKYNSAVAIAGLAVTTAEEFEKTNAEVEKAKDGVVATQAMLNSQVENINGSLETISNDVTELKDKVANTASKEELNDKVGKTEFNILNQQVNQNSVDVAEAKAAANEVADDLNEFKYNSAVAIAGLAVTTAEEFEKTNAEVEKTKDAVAATQAMLDSQVKNINGSLETISNDVTDLKGKVANAATKDDLKQKANQSDFNQLTQQVNQNSADAAEAKAAANEVANDLNEFKYNSAVAIAGLAVTTAEEFEKTNAEVEKAKDGVVATQAMLNSQVENINGSLATISNDVTELKDKVANTASKEELNDKVGKTEFNILNQQVNQNSVDVAEAKAAANEVANDLNEFKYNSAVAIAGLAVTTAEEFEKTNAEVEKAKDGVVATQAMLNSQVENINGSLATISNDVTELKDKVANTASKEELNDKVGKTEFTILNQQVNQNSNDIAEVKNIANSKADQAAVEQGLAQVYRKSEEHTNNQVRRLDDKKADRTEVVQALDAKANKVVVDAQLKALDETKADQTAVEQGLAQVYRKSEEHTNNQVRRLDDKKADRTEVVQALDAKANKVVVDAQLKALDETKADQTAVEQGLAQVYRKSEEHTNNQVRRLDDKKADRTEVVQALDAKANKVVVDAQLKALDETKADQTAVEQGLAQVYRKSEEHTNNQVRRLDDKKADRTEVVQALDAKANKVVVDAQLKALDETKADQTAVEQGLAQVYRKSEEHTNNQVRRLDDKKADRTEVVQALDAKANKVVVDAQLKALDETKADQTAVEQGLAQVYRKSEEHTNNQVRRLDDKKADRTEVVQALDAKANKVVVDAQLKALDETKADQTAVEQGLAQVYRKSEEHTNNQVRRLDDKKADRTEVVQALDAKANKVVVDAQLKALDETKVDKTEVSTIVAKDLAKDNSDVTQAVTSQVIKLMESNDKLQEATSTVILEDIQKDGKIAKQVVNHIAETMLTDGDLKTNTQKVATQAIYNDLKDPTSNIATQVQTNVVNAMQEKGSNLNEATKVIVHDAIANNQTIQQHGEAIKGLEYKYLGLDQKVEKLGVEMDKGFAAQAALTGLFQPYNVGKVNTSVALGGYKSQNAIAFGAGYRPNENFAIKGGFASSTSGGNTSYNIGINYEW